MHVANLFEILVSLCNNDKKTTKQNKKNSRTKVNYIQRHILYMYRKHEI